MTREEAIAFFRDMNECTYGNLEAVEMAIKALEQEPCEDAVSRKAVIDTLDEMDKVLNEDRTVERYIDLLKECYTVLPSVNPQKIGHWINEKVFKLFPSKDYKCSVCGNTLDFGGVNCGRGDANYCPNCGARMVEPQESGDKE